jgi:hypothetical protein
MIPPTSASQFSRMIGLNHCANIILL